KAAYREALKEWGRDRVPLDWAMTQNNLGYVLWRLGEQENSVQELEEAVAAYREALKERLRERVPLDWAQTQTNLAYTLRSLGKRTGASNALEEALNALQGAWQVYQEAKMNQYDEAFQATVAELAQDLGKMGGQKQPSQPQPSAARPNDR